MLKEYLTVAFKEGNDVYYFREGNASFRLSKRNDVIVFADETEKIELHASADDVNQLHNMMKGQTTLAKNMKNNLSIKEILEGDFDKEERRTINGKPYIVYDIETENVTSTNLATHNFTIAYALFSESGQYKFIGQESMKKFMDHLLEFDGYIIGFNHVGYDNIVLAYNCGYGPAEIEKLNEKSIDLFLFVYHMLQRRMSLNKLGAALVGAKKTLESGLEGIALRRKYKDEGDEKALATFKKYCKNDVTVTHLILLYFLKYQKLVGEEGKDMSFDEAMLLNLSKPRKEDVPQNQQQSMFS